MKKEGSGDIEQLTYEDWVVLLGEHFFTAEAAGRPVRYCPDDEILSELSRLNEAAAVASLASCCRSRTSRRHAYNIFQRALQEGTRWKVGGAEGFPPFLPILALAVLAAVHMAQSDGIASTNYYKRFRELLDLPGRGMPKGYDETFPYLWKSLDWWLSDHLGGQRGLSTISEDPNWTNIGFALTQALIRRSDRQRLTFFFQWMGFEPGESVEPEELFARFKAWAPGRVGLSNGIQVMVSKPEYEERLSAALAAEAARWDGSLRDEHGRRVALLHFTLRLNPQIQLGLMAPRPDGFPEQAWFSGADGRGIDLSSSDEGWYDQELTGPWVAMGLESGFRLTSGELVLEMRPDEVIPFRGNLDLGCWSSVRQLAPRETHWVLSAQKHSSELARFFSRYAAEGWSKEAVGPPLGDAWTLFRDVAVNEVPESELPGVLARLLPTPTNRASLQGGLPMPGHRYYLVGGEPDLWIPSGGPDETYVEVSIDGLAEEARPSSLISLSQRQLVPGMHEVVVGGSSLQFRTMETSGVREPPQSRSLVHVIENRNGEPIATRIGARQFSDEDLTNTCVSGSLIFGAISSEAEGEVPPLVLPVGPREIYLLGRVPGQIGQPQQVAAPGWLRSQHLESNRFEWHPSFEVIWIVLRWNPGGWHYRLKTPVPPGTTSQDEDLDLDLWAEILELEGPEGDAATLWAQYRATARSHREL